MPDIDLVSLFEFAPTLPVGIPFDTVAFDTFTWDAGGVPSYDHRYSTKRDPRIPTFESKIRSHIALNRERPKPLVKERSLVARTAEITLSNVDAQDTVVAPTISYLRSLSPVLGYPGKATLRDIGNSVDLLTLAGKITRIAGLNRKDARITVSVDDRQIMKRLVPGVLTRDLFPSVDTSTVGAHDHPVVVPFGLFRDAELALVMGANYVDCTFTLTGAEPDKYLYVDLTNITDVAIGSGYFLEYDVYWQEDGAFIALDLETTDATKLRDQAVNDQNGFAAHPQTDISSKCRTRIYRRRISLASLAGKTVSKYKIGCEADAAGTYHAKIGQAVIVNAGGVIVKEIITRNFSSFTTAVDETSNAGNSATITKDNNWYFGPVYDPSATTTLHAAYRNGRVVPAAEYTHVWLFGTRLLRFSTVQLYQNGSPVKIVVAIESAEFGSIPSNVGKFLLQDIDYGGGQTIDSTNFDSAASDYTTLQLTCDGGLDRQRPLGDVLQDLLWHGAYLWKNTDGQYQWLVDTLAAHSAATIELGEGTVRGLDNMIILDPPDLDIANIVKKLRLRGGKFRGHGGEESWQLSTARTQQVADTYSSTMPMEMPADMVTLQSSVGSVEGEEITLDFPYVHDLAVLDRLAHYLFEQARAYEEPLQVEAKRLDAALALALDKYVDVYAPHMQLAGATYVVTKEQRRGADATFSLVAWRPGAYTYSAGTDQNPGATQVSLIDYSHTPPSAPQNLRLVAEVIRVTSENLIESIVTIAADAPTTNPDNISDLRFQKLRRGTLFILEEILLPVAPLQTDATIDFKLEVGQQYTIRCQARNSANVPESQNGAFATNLDLDGPKNQTKPATPTGFDVVAGILVANGSWTLGSEDDLARHRLYRNAINDFATASEVAIAEGRNTIEAQDTQFSVDDVPKTFYYFLTAENSSGTKSDPAAAASNPVTVDKVTGVQTTTQTDIELTSSAETIVATTPAVPVLAGSTVDVSGAVIVGSGSPVGNVLLRIRQTNLAGAQIGSHVWKPLSGGSDETVEISQRTDENPAASQVYVLTVLHTGASGGSPVTLLTASITTRNFRA